MKIYKIDKAYMESEEDLKKIIVKFIKAHGTLGNHYKKLQDYYETAHDILKRTEPDETKPNNMLVNNYAKYITDIAVGYFLGIAPTYNAKEKTFDDGLKEMFTLNHEADENSELGKQCSMKGIAYEMLYQDTDGSTRFKWIDPASAFLVYDTSIQEDILFGIRFYDDVNPIDDSKQTKVELYTDTNVYYFVLVDDILTLSNEVQHFFGEVPIVEYINNEELKGDFEVVMSLIDAYNNSQSDTANDFEYFTDAYLALVGMQGTEASDIEALKKQRVILLEADGDAKWLVKEINDAATENYKNRLQEDISRFSMVPSLTDESFAGNQSGVALKYKLWGLEQLTATKERKFESSLRRRLKLICNILNIKGNSFDYKTVDISFYRNIPANLLEVADMLSKLAGTVSQETKLEQIPFITDVKAEMKRLDAEMEKQMQEFKLNPNVDADGSDGDGGNT